MARVITEDKLFRLFIAALRVDGQTFIEVRNDRHHARFAQAVEVLREAQATGEPSAARFPRTLVASPFTGRFASFDQALLYAQETGTSGSQNPFYPGADLPISQRRAERTLETLTDDERSLLKRMVEAFDREPESPLLGAGSLRERG